MKESNGPRRLRWLRLRGRHLLALDLIAVTSSFILSLALRFDAPSDRFIQFLTAYVWLIPLLIVTRIVAFVVFRLYQRVWHYASVDELLAVVAAIAVSSIAAYAFVFGVVAVDPNYRSLGFPRSVAIIDSILALTLAGAWRFGLRVLGAGRLGARARRDGSRTLIVGSGSAAIAAIRELRDRPELGLVPIGMLADDLPIGQRLLSIPVVGTLADLAESAAASNADVALLALPTAQGRELRRLVHASEAAGMRCLTVPSVAEVVAGRVSMNGLREVEIDDLLRRAPARIDLESISTSFRGKTVLITGAGGSIGGELARHVLQLRPGQLILLGRGENSLFDTLHSLPRGSVGIDPVVLDVTNAGRLDSLFAQKRPDIVFHAAAHKHVTFMEQFPEEAVWVNVLGTFNALTSAARHGVERFVFISSDKAVNPTSVMGATKRVGELLVQDMALRTGARYSTVRFGNVLSSRGSVVPLFRRQLQAGGPLTVTDPNVTRYFMTIAEAIQLVLQASVLAEAGGSTFVLDMGEPVRIAQLAQDLVELHGLEVGTDIELEFVGLRPGEKLVEELYFAEEQPTATTHEAVRRIVRSDWATPPGLRDAVAELADLASRGDRHGIIASLKRVVPEYQPSRPGLVAPPAVTDTR